MGADTKIQWTDYTFNPWRGCTKIAPGCANCYAERESRRFPAMRGIWGPSGTRVRASDAMWKEPLKWDRAAAERMAKFLPDQRDGVARPRVFCASLADVFESWDGDICDHKGRRLRVNRDKPSAYLHETPGYSFASARPARMDDLRRDLFALIDATPNLDWLLLTKRPENIRRMWPRYSFDACLTGDCQHDTQAECDAAGPVLDRDNVWLGTSVSDQTTADAMLPELLKCRDLAPVLFASYEPALGPAYLEEYLWSQQGGESAYLDWVIVGGESGAHARPFVMGWAKDTIRQCREAGAACFVKQLGAKPTNREGIGHIFRDKKGGDWSEWPEDLRVREFPTTPALVVPR